MYFRFQDSRRRLQVADLNMSNCVVHKVFTLERMNVARPKLAKCTVERMGEDLSKQIKE